MFFGNFVRLLLLLGVIGLCESSVVATENTKKQASDDLRKTILSVVDQQVQYCENDDTDALMTLVDPEITIVMDGYPLLSGFEGAKVMFEALPETASHIENTYKDVVPLDEDANYVYVTLHFDFFNESGVNYKDGSGLFLLKKTSDGYKFYIMAISAHDQPSS